MKENVRRLIFKEKNFYDRGEYEMRKFQNGDRVCFVGDSITHNGMFVNQIIAYYRRHFPEEHIEFYNCGIAGGNLGNTIKIYDEDIALYAPTHIVLMIGVNDSRRDHLNDPADGKYDFLSAAYEGYRKNLEIFYNMTREMGVKLTLCTPAPYDEYGRYDAPAFRGGYALIMGYAELVRAFARDNGLDLCDYHAEMTKVMQTEVLYAPDRIHPTETGHFVMARTLLAAQGLELSAPMKIDKELEAWYDATQRIRNIIAAEFILVPNYIELSHKERSAAIKKRLAEAENGTNPTDDYIRSLMHRHIANKPHQNEHVEFVKSFMKACRQ